MMGGMTTVRCYVPLSPDQLATLSRERRLPGPLPATAVTDAVRAANAAGDRDEWEDDALQEAAAGLVAGSRPVVVAAVDLTEDRVDAGHAQGAAVVVGNIDLSRVAAIHVGDDVVSSDPAALGPAGEAVELSWYDTTEIALVVDLARSLEGA